MITVTIDIPDNNVDEVLALLAKYDVKVREPNWSKLDELTLGDYKLHFRQRAELNKKNLHKSLNRSSG